MSGAAYYARWSKTPKGRASRQRANAKYARSAGGKEVARQRNIRDRAKGRVRWAVSRAVRMGHIEKHPCFACGESKVQAHHHKGYSKRFRLDVIWLCQTHHTEAHRLKKQPQA